jgi:hypothetical protein
MLPSEFVYQVVGIAVRKYARNEGFVEFIRDRLEWPDGPNNEQAPVAVTDMLYQAFMAGVRSVPK